MKGGNRLLDLMRMAEPHVCAGPYDPEPLVKGEKGLEQVLFAPETSHLFDPDLGVFLWKEDIMQMDQYTRLETWKHLKEDLDHITSNAYHVTGVKEKDVVRPQTLEDIPSGTLDGFLVKPDYLWHGILDALHEGPRIGVQTS